MKRARGTGTRSLTDNIDITRSQLGLNTSAIKTYVELRKAESAWIAACEVAGATVYKPSSQTISRSFKGVDLEPRRAVVMVPPSVVLPDSSNLLSCADDWRNTVIDMRNIQGKDESSVGVRSITPPVWVGVSDTTNWLAPANSYIIGQRPEVNVKQVTYRTQNAYRGGLRPAAEIKDYLLTVCYTELEELAEYEKSLEQNLVFDKKEKEKEKENIEHDRDILNRQIEEVLFLCDPKRCDGGRFISGEAFFLHLSPESGNAYQARIKNIGLIAVAEEFKFFPAPTRERRPPGIRKVVICRIELHIKDNV